MAETIAMPKLGFDMQEGTLVKWLRSEGDSIEKGDVLAEIETDKATVEVESSAAGFVRRLLVDQGAVVPIGDPIAIVGAKDEKIEVPSVEAKAGESSQSGPPVAEVPAAMAVSATTAEPQLPEESGTAKASPLAKKMAREANLDLGAIPGTGPGGRVVRRDVEAALAGKGATTRTAPAAPRIPVSAGPRADEQVALTKLRQAIGRRMTESKSHVPHFYVGYEYRADALVAVREQANQYMDEQAKISVNDFVVKAAALCLREFPNLNAAFQGDHVLRHGSINVGVAVAVEGGLLTVVCKDADLKPLPQISQEIREMAARVRSGKVRSDDIEGSTFSVSNLGMFGVENFAAIINPPEAAILAVGAARQVPVVDGESIRPGWRMKATIAVDHRVSDGAEAARFMKSLARYIEAPAGLLL
jgi:pyruvate dehydrogenase E2 component (dihydrolipoamide acetyltransferase)